MGSDPARVDVEVRAYSPNGVKQSREMLIITYPFDSPPAPGVFNELNGVSLESALSKKPIDGSPIECLGKYLSSPLLGLIGSYVASVLLLLKILQVIADSLE